AEDECLVWTIKGQIGRPIGITPQNRNGARIVCAPVEHDLWSKLRKRSCRIGANEEVEIVVVVRRSQLEPMVRVRIREPGVDGSCNVDLDPRVDARRTNG